MQVFQTNEWNYDLIMLQTSCFEWHNLNYSSNLDSIYWIKIKHGIAVWISDEGDNKEVLICMPMCCKLCSYASQWMIPIVHEWESFRTNV